jgi:hypothetical protein
MLFDLLMAVFMEQTSRKSGLPPSQTSQDDPPSDTKLATRATGQDQSHRSRENTRTIKTVTSRFAARSPPTCIWGRIGCSRSRSPPAAPWI